MESFGPFAARVAAFHRAPGNTHHAVVVAVFQGAREAGRGLVVPEVWRKDAKHPMPWSTEALQAQVTESARARSKYSGSQFVSVQKRPPPFFSFWLCNFDCTDSAL